MSLITAYTLSNAAIGFKKRKKASRLCNHVLNSVCSEGTTLLFTRKASVKALTVGRRPRGRYDNTVRDLCFASEPAQKQAEHQRSTTGSATKVKRRSRDRVSRDVFTRTRHQ